MRRRDKSSGAVLAHASPEGVAKDYPSLAEFMTCASFEGEDGIRHAPTLTIWCQGGLWRASVRDKEEDQVLWLSDQTFWGLMQLIDEMVLAQGAPWRFDDNENGHKGKRVPRVADSNGRK